jgi:hypothetical protein
MGGSGGAVALSSSVQALSW